MHGNWCRSLSVHSRTYETEAGFQSRVAGSLGVYPTTSVILLGMSPLWRVSLWEALSVVSQKWSTGKAM